MERGIGNCLRILALVALWTVPFFSAPGGAAEYENDVSGIYYAEDGAEARVYPLKASDRWRITFAAPGRMPLHVYFEGKASSLTPIGLDTALQFRDAPLEVVVEEDRLYGAGYSDGRVIEFYSTPSEKTIHTLLDGKRSSRKDVSSHEIELRLVAQSVADTWGVIRNSQVQVSGNLLKVIPSHQHPQRQDMSIKLYRKKEDLSEEEMESLEDVVAVRKKKMEKLSRLTSHDSENLRY